MEEVKLYIESGILELYVLGQLSAQECIEVEDMAAKYPEVKAELSAIEIALEAYAMENAIEPSAKLEAQIFAQIENDINLSPQNEITEPKVIPLFEDNKEGKVRKLRYALIACSILLAISLGALFSAHNELNIAQNQIATLSLDQQKFTSTVSKLEFEKAGMKNRIAMTESEEWTTVKLAGVKGSPESKMLVYWNKLNKNILINYAAMELPKTDEAHEYQLWALVDGKPVSLGVFEENGKEAVKQMETIGKAQAFAVTIEPVGGSINPTMEKMVVMGAITI